MNASAKQVEFQSTTEIRLKEEKRSSFIASENVIMATTANQCCDIRPVPSCLVTSKLPESCSELRQCMFTIVKSGEGIGY